MATKQQKNPMLQIATKGDVVRAMQQLARQVEARLERAGLPRNGESDADWLARLREEEKARPLAIPPTPLKKRRWWFR